MEDQIITPFEASTKTGKFNYQKLIDEFGVEPITQDLINRFEILTGHKVHTWIRRGLFFAHRELNKMLDDYEQGKPIFIYTGRGPSNTMHLGHSIPFIMTKWLQDIFNAIVVIQIADDEKYYFKDMQFKDVYDLGFENAKDIIAFGFNPDKTFIFSNRDYATKIDVHNFICELMKVTHINHITPVFGIKPDMPIGCLVWPLYQIAAAFSQFYKPIFGSNQTRCVVVYSVDQDPYFRSSRDIAVKINSYKPCSVIGQFLPALEGTGKMSSTQKEEDKNKPITTIFLNDDSKTIFDKIKKHAFSGGKETLKEHREKGADLDVDISYAYLQYFEEDDEKLKQIANDYGTGKMLTSEIKKYMADKVIKFVQNHQSERSKINSELLNKFYDINKFSH
ncbi:tryptophanyl-tRNA synthetase [Fadolivirus algeromassiliense]|jgi:tryptophanyl-tRNA synthetase|uniref:tryptophan--tRNA ligase n=1 Tax=Fadolivirus FV1/VV64 TaxID=3070911 RepID=A0A7D3R2J3_9VIRU|nr:tryptophanyl-tRNA synthetase [Fadolivirus algeromassiliense]QKF94558.1 tryptophanyl-tRNA synthetase [Fadolivirus FV1/VV64]